MTTQLSFLNPPPPLFRTFEQPKEWSWFLCTLEHTETDEFRKVKIQAWIEDDMQAALVRRVCEMAPEYVLVSFEDVGQ